MATLSLKPNSRKIPPLTVKQSSSKTTDEWEFGEVGVLRHKTGFSIQFFNADECEITNIPKDMSLSMVRELTASAIKAKKRQYR